MKRIALCFLFILCILNGYSQDKTTLADYSYLIFKTPVLVNSSNISQIRSIRIDWGTCFFIRIKNRLFLVTAGHVVDKVQSPLIFPNPLTEAYKPDQLSGRIPNDIIQLPNSNPYFNSSPSKIDSQLLAMSNWVGKGLPVNKQQGLNFGLDASQVKVDSQVWGFNKIPTSQIKYQKNTDIPDNQPINNSVFDQPSLKVDSQYFAFVNLPSGNVPNDKSDLPFQFPNRINPLNRIPLKADSAFALIGNIQTNSVNLDSLMKNLPKTALFQGNPTIPNQNWYSGVQLSGLMDQPEYLELRYYDSMTKKYEFCEIQYDPQVSYGLDMTHPDVRVIEVSGLPKTAVINSIEKFLPKASDNGIDSAFFWGFPQDDQPNLFAKSLSLQDFLTQSPSLYDGHIETFTHTFPPGVDQFYYVLNPQTHKGASGSPIFFIYSKSTGIRQTRRIAFGGVQSAINAGLNTTYAVKADEVLKVLNDEFKN